MGERELDAAAGLRRQILAALTGNLRDLTFPAPGHKIENNNNNGGDGDSSAPGIPRRGHMVRAAIAPA